MSRPTSAAPLPDGAEVRIVTRKDDAALEVVRHSTAHVLAQAVLELWPGATFAGGPAIENGFYYDFELPDGGSFSEDDLSRIDGAHAQDHRGQPALRAFRATC